MSFRHGASGYRRHKCRCEVCRAGHAADQRVQRAKEADEEVPADGPRPFEDDPEFAFMRVCNIGWFPRNAAGEFEAVQRVCALPKGHDGQHSEGT